MGVASARRSAVRVLGLGSLLLRQVRPDDLLGPTWLGDAQLKFLDATHGMGLEYIKNQIIFNPTQLHFNIVN